MVELIKNRGKCIVNVHNKALEIKKEEMQNVAITENNPEITKRLGMGLAFGLFVSFLIYAVISGDKVLTEKVAIGSIRNEK